MQHSLLFAAVLAISLPSLCRAEPDAVLVSARGRVQVSLRGEERFGKAGPGTPLLLGDKIRVLKGSSAHLVFANGAALLLKENSSLELSGGAGAVSVSFSEGEFLIGFTRPPAPGSSLVVKTPGSSALIGGALYWGRCDPQHGTTYQTFGSALPVASRGGTTLIEPGQSLHFPVAEAPEGPRPPEIALDYLGTFALEDSLEGLGDISRQAAAPSPPPSPPLAAPERPPVPRLRIEVHPRLSFMETYDDNIYLVARDKPGPDTVGGGHVGSWISAGNLGFNYALPLSRKHNIQGTADLAATIYSSKPRTNNAYDSSETVSYAYTGKTSAAKLSNAFQNTELPAFSELVVRQRHWQDATKLTLSLARDRLLAFDLDGQHTAVKYLDRTLGGLLNHYDQLFGGRAGLKLAPKTHAFVAYHRGLTHYSAGRNAGSKSHLIDAGLEGALSARLKGLFQTGYQYRRYDFAAGLPGVARLWQTTVELKYEASRSLILNLRGFRNFSESTFGANRHYVASGASLAAAYTLQRLSLGLSGNIETDRYPEAVTVSGLRAFRRDDIYGAGVSADYRFRRWLKLGVSFNRLDRFSTFSRQFDYADDRTSVSLKAEF